MFDRRELPACVEEQSVLSGITKPCYPIDHLGSVCELVTAGTKGSPDPTTKIKVWKR